MKRFLTAILFCICLPVFAQYESVEEFTVYNTQVTLCTNKGKSYLLIQNGYQDIPEALVVYPDKEFTARQIYGEILIKYYKIKNNKKEVKEYRPGELYTVYLDNSEEEIAFLASLTDQFTLAEYKTFYFIDKNYSKNETHDKEDIGSSAGYLMGIKATDFVNYVRSM